MQDPQFNFACSGCSQPLGFGISMAFQPIVDIEDGEVFAYEALVRGENGEPAGQVLAQVSDENRFAFDQLCRVRAVETAAALGMRTKLSINFMPNAVYEPSRCLKTTLEAAERTKFPVERIIFEATEQDRIRDTERLKCILGEYKHQGFLTAIDDFGAGYAGLDLLAAFQPDIVKLDMNLIRGIDRDRARGTIVRGIVGMAHQLGIRIVAEGIETAEEMLALHDLGITLMQGYLFARPQIGALSVPQIPQIATAQRASSSDR